MPNTSRPSKVIRPASGFSMPTISLPSVVLPQPDSPTSPSASPTSTCRFTPDTALTELTLRWRIAPAVTGYSRTPSTDRALLRRRRRTVHRVPAREEVIGTDAVQRRLLRSTLVGGVRTARSKAAAGGGGRPGGGGPRGDDP